MSSRQRARPYVEEYDEEDYDDDFDSEGEPYNSPSQRKTPHHRSSPNHPRRADTSRGLMTDHHTPPRRTTRVSDSFLDDFGPSTPAPYRPSYDRFNTRPPLDQGYNLNEAGPSTFPPASPFSRTPASAYRQRGMTNDYYPTGETLRPAQPPLNNFSDDDMSPLRNATQDYDFSGPPAGLADRFAGLGIYDNNINTMTNDEPILDPNIQYMNDDDLAAYLASAPLESQQPLTYDSPPHIPFPSEDEDSPPDPLPRTVTSESDSDQTITHHRRTKSTNIASKSHHKSHSHNPSRTHRPSSKSVPHKSHTASTLLGNMTNIFSSRTSKGIPNWLKETLEGDRDFPASFKVKLKRMKSTLVVPFTDDYALKVEKDIPEDVVQELKEMTGSEEHEGILSVRSYGELRRTKKFKSGWKLSFQVGDTESYGDLGELLRDEDTILIKWKEEDDGEMVLLSDWENKNG
ncbi:hypothetical protein M231_03923 [Tremella mesenterica]|uniref:Uncharacterized protein n=1 Tax=Tremella mesenterica TaxID=5217 RepID=A0A4V1M411_TREME|nr:uncharacterized protein TREMEDRAFT_64837 [Tremella mesenterica DSM 1558]EIW66977.1 hypothetical protein TREMEDRAFT_64837 [Tremella mesenterica DSM 1558]RXK38747.1 hypothetical protein M231_03923 [Tremella mesenterica]